MTEEEEEELWGPISDGEVATILSKSQKLQLGRKHLQVSLLAQQLWCELRLVFQLTEPSIPLPPEETANMAAGAAVHLQREQEVEVSVEVEILTREDAFAVEVSNLIDVLNDFFVCGTTVRREVPIFGMPFGSTVVVKGCIDELRYDPERHELTVVELKTRRQRSEPGRAQHKMHTFQIRLYSRLLAELPDLKTDALTKALRLKSAEPLSPQVALQLGAPCLEALLVSLRELSPCLPTSPQLLLEYAHQKTAETFFMDFITQDNTALRLDYQDLLDFWLHYRKPRGVTDVEDIPLKCQGCPYSHMCSWPAQLLANNSQQLQQAQVAPSKTSCHS